MVALAAAVVEAVKFERRTRAGLAPGDALAAAALCACAGAPGAFAGPGAAALGAAAGALFFLGVWLDAALFRVYSIELGLNGIRSMVLPVLYRELSEVAFARAFFRAHRTFFAAPLAAALALGALALAPASRPAALIALAGACALALASARAVSRSPRGPLLAWQGAALLALVAAAPGAAAGPWLLGASVAAALWAMRPPFGHGGAVGFLRSRRLPRRRPPVPFPEHASLLRLAPRPPARSALHGIAGGADVLLWTTESMGREFTSLHGGPARTPFLEAVAREGACSRHHFCLCPLTNDAHIVLYGGTYASLARSALGPLRAAGYRTVYLTPSRTEHYGFDALLRQAGFDAIIDRRALSSGRDSALEPGGLELALAGARGQPLFLHVHTANTHLPYSVEEPARFSHFDPAEDLGRYLDALEEADALLERFARAFAGHRGPPLLVVSGDHGQSFGRMGYRSHGSAIVREQVNVPLALRHPRLPRTEVRWSSHFDVLPTVLDLLGVPDTRDGYGDSMFAGRQEPGLVLWAGRAARSTTSNLGVLVGERKCMLDLVRDECLELSWDDEARRLEGAERAAWTALVAHAFRAAGLR